ncbi:hypothetical protein SLS56_010720 [Neofusicoccum ribis]|uniref:Uncharacterized protein n=1 Tax=Neofusicoccum ribis TaxID=45134 RepID=A0ABR3SDM6_9PEZI
MGVTISKTSELSPISFVSTLFGFLGFAFTIATFLRVTWENIQTILGASTQVPDLLGNLKQGLYEERAHLRKVRRWQRRRGSFQGGPRGGPEKADHWYGHGYLDSKDLHDDDQSTRVMREAIRNMIREFRHLEQPFLRDDVEIGRHVRNGEGYADEDDEEYYRTEYRPCGWRERYLWLRRKGAVVDMMSTLSRLETRRIAKEVGEACLIVRGMERDFQIIDDRIWNLEQRMTRVVGVRRVEPH